MTDLHPVQVDLVDAAGNVLGSQPALLRFDLARGAAFLDRDLRFDLPRPPWWRRGLLRRNRVGAAIVIRIPQGEPLFELPLRAPVPEGGRVDLEATS